MGQTLRKVGVTGVSRTVLLVLLPMLPIGAGVAIMRALGVSRAFWVQNLVAAAIGTLFCLALVVRGAWIVRWNRVLIVLAVGVLAATLGFEGLMGVHRWVLLGPMRVHGAFLVVPIAIVAVFALLRSSHVLWGLVGSFVLQALLLVQPDASQATALAGAFFVAAAGSRLQRITRAVAAFGHILFAVAAWSRPDCLVPTPHVEGIVGLAAGCGSVWGIAAAAALVLIPFPFLAFLRGRAREGRATNPGFALAVYWCFLLLATLFGAFPVPLMGYGVSPILGYYLGLGAAQASGKSE